MTKTNLAAWTPAEKNPPYVSINYVDGTIEITVRERETKDGSLGCVATVKLTQGEFIALMSDVKNTVDIMNARKR